MASMLPIHVPSSLEPVKRRWRFRDWLAGVLLFAATLAFVLWQNSRQTVLWDISYVLDSSYRIAAGQLPYLDFPFVHAPFLFLTQAALIRLTGRVYWHHILYAAILGGLASVFCWRAILRILEGRVPYFYDGVREEVRLAPGVAVQEHVE